MRLRRPVGEPLGRRCRPARTIGLGLVGAAVIGLVAAQLAPPARATAPPSGPGSALATSSLLTVGPSYEGLNITVTAGASTAYYQAADAQATSAAVDAATLSGLTGSAPSISAIEPLTADSASGPASKSSGSPLLGHESVQVKGTPAASATTQLISVDLPGLLQIDGASSATASYTSAGEQTAAASTDVSIQLLGGLVSLDGVRWTASQQRGKKAVTDGTFHVGSIEVAHVPLPVGSPAQLATALAAANRALASLGVAILMPTTSTDPTSGTVTVSGLDLRLAKSFLTNALIEPLISPVASVEQQIGKALASGGNSLAQLASTLGTGELLAGLVLGILAGAGQVNLLVGGVTANSQLPAAFTNPFGTPSSGGDGGASPGLSTGPAPGSASASVSVDSPPSTPGSVGPSVSAPATAGPPATATETQISPARTGPVRCDTTSPAGHPGCWQGAATLAAAVLLGAGVALFGGEAYVSRRRRFRVVREVIP